MKKHKGKGIYQLFIIMILVILLLTITTIIIIYKIVYQEKREFLHVLCMNQKEMIQSIYSETNDVDRILNILYHQKAITEGLGTTGEFAIGYSKNDSIHYLLRMRQSIQSNNLPITLGSNRAIPMQYALSQNTGFIEGPDYKCTMVLSYCSYIPELKWGIVTKMDVSEVRLPFYKTGLYAIIASLILILIAIILFLKASRPITKKIEESEENYRRLFEYSAIPIWKEDYSEIKKYFENIKLKGVTDFRTYFETHKDEINHLASLIKVVEINQKSVEFFDAESKEDVIKNMLFYFNEASLVVFREELIMLAGGGRQFECEMPIRTLSGNVKTLYMHLAVVKGFEETLSHVLVSFMDITERKANEEKLIRLKEEWIETFDLIPDMITILDNRHKILRANKAATEKLGILTQDIIGLHCFQCVHGKQESPSFCPHIMMIKDGKEHITDFYEEKLGMDLLVSVTPIYDNNGNISGSVHIARDITEQKKKEKELNKLNRILSALGKSSQEMTRASEESLYLNEVCKIIIDQCGYKMVWIGYAEDDLEKSVRPVAFSGFEEGYLETLNVSWADTERGNGPTGTTIRTGELSICKNMLTDSAFKPWLKDAVKRGYASSIVVPLKTENKAFGAISIYSKEPDAFSNEEVELLSEIANDLAYGIISLRSRIAQIEIEEALKKSEAQVRIKLQSILSPEGDIKQLELSDVIDIPAIQSLINNLQALVHIPMAIIDLEGKVLVGVGWQEVCTEFHRVNPETCKNCIESDVQLSINILEGEYKLYKCKNNLWDIATPVIIGGEHKGNLFMGQFFFDDEIVDYDFFRAQAKKYNFDEKQYLNALDKVPRLSREKLDYAKSFFRDLAQSLSQLSYSNIKLARSISEKEMIENEMLRSIGRLDILSNTASQFLASTNPQMIINELCTWVMEFLDCQMFFNFLVDEKAGRLHLNTYAGIPEKTARTIEWLDYGVAVCGCVARDAKRIITENIPETPDTRTDLIKSFSVKAYCCHPIMAQGKVLGTLSFGTTNKISFSSGDIDMMNAITDLVAIAMNRIKNEETIRISEEKFRAIATHTPDHILIQDKSLRYILVINPQLGLTEKDMIGKTDYEVLSKEDAINLTKLKKKVLETGNPEYISIPLVSLNGETQYFNGVYVPKHDSQGMIDGIIGYFRNVTERKKAEDALRESEEMLRSVLNATQESIYMFDKDGNFTISNSTGLKRLNNISEKELIGRHFSEFMSPELTKQRQEKLYQVFTTGNPVEFEDERNGILLRHNFFPVFKDKEVSGIVTYSKDITEGKRFENELKEKNAELKELNATKDKFFKIIAHDMKNPFISLIGASELLLENVHKYDSDKITKLTKILNDSAKNGYNMLLNILDWARSQAGSMMFQPEMINLKELINKNLASSVEYASNKKIKLDFEITDNMQVFADKNMLETILRNLINNALKFTPSGGVVTVGAKNEMGTNIIFIKDTGVGIDKNDFNKLFRTDIKFSQPGTDHEGGTGLGLLLCKEFAETHGGKIWVESEVKKGSIFYFSLVEERIHPDPEK